MKYVQTEFEEMSNFFDKMGRAAKHDLHREMCIWLEGMAFEFLKFIQNEILKNNIVDSRQLLHSFQKDTDYNVWEVSENGLRFEVGSLLEYAGYVNDGHWLNAKGVERRFVPGYWQGDRFIYDRNADGGMMLKQDWVKGKRYFDVAFGELSKEFVASLEKKLEEWFDSYF